VVIDHFDVVGVGVEHERALVARVVLGPLARAAGSARWTLRAVGRSSRSTENEPLSPVNWTKSPVARVRVNPANGPIRS